MRRLILALLAVSCVLPLANAYANPVNNIPPEVIIPTGRHVAVNEELVCDPGSWTGIVNHFNDEWVSNGRVVSSGQGDSAYKIKTTDEGHEIWCIVTAEGNSGEDTIVESINSFIVPGGSPQEEVHNKTPPELSGEPAVGKTLTCKEGTWSGNPTPTLTVKWLRGEGEPIPGATGATYVVTSEDAGDTLECKVTASNGVGSEVSKLSNSVTIPAEAPANKERPTVKGEQDVGGKLTCQPGKWTGTEPIVFTYQWLKDGSSVGDTSSIFKVEREDEGQSIACEVTATNASGVPATARSEPVSISFGLLESIEPPTITGTTKVGSTLECSTGTWNGDPTGFKYQWLKETETEPKETIGTATKATFTVLSNDAGDSLYCQVTAERGSSSLSRTSAPVTIPRGSGAGAPKEESGSKPELIGETSGEASVGETLTCKPGNWSGSPRFSYAWRRLSEKNAIGGADKATYEVQGADQGHALVCIVTAANGEGQATAESEPLPVKGLAPENRSLPEILPAGAPHVGETLACTEGQWSAAPPPAFTYQWLLEGSEQVGVGASYVVTASDRGHRLSCVVTAENGVGSPVHATSASVAVPGSVPEDTEQPSISGTPTLGSTLTCAAGTWGGAPEPTYTYQWLVQGEEIAGATTATFSVQSADRGFVLSCRVTASNREGNASATSKGVHVPGARPEDLEQPSVSGNAGVGQTLTCVKGVWNGKPPPEFKYQWLREGVAIAAAGSSDTHTVEAADIGHLLTCDVLATNVEGSVEAESSNGVVIAGHTAPPKVEPSIDPGVKTVLPTAAEIRASLERQLSSVVGVAHLKSVIKVGGYAFSFTAPEAGTLELQWTQAPTKGAHGSAKRKPLVLARSSTPFTGARKGMVSLKLTRLGREALKGKKRISLTVTATFLIPHERPVIWSGTLVLAS
jgi:hypothetical protein